LGFTDNPSPSPKLPGACGERPHWSGGVMKYLALIGRVIEWGRGAGDFLIGGA